MNGVGVCDRRNQPGVHVSRLLDRFHLPSGYTHHRGHGGYVRNDNRSRTDHGFVSDSGALNNRRADSDERTGLDRDATGQSCAGANVRSRTDQAFMIDDASCVENHGVTDLTVGADQSPCGDDDVSTQGDVSGEIGRGVYRVDEFEVPVFDKVGEGSPCSVVANGDDGVADVHFFANRGKIFGATQDRNSVNSPADRGFVRVDKTDDVVRSGIHQDVEHDASMSPAAQNHAGVFGSVIFVHGVGTSSMRLFEPPRRPLGHKPERMNRYIPVMAAAGSRRRRTKAPLALIGQAAKRLNANPEDGWKADKG